MDGGAGPSVAEARLRDAPPADPSLRMADLVRTWIDDCLNEYRLAPPRGGEHYEWVLRVKNVPGACGTPNLTELVGAAVGRETASGRDAESMETRTVTYDFGKTWLFGLVAGPTLAGKELCKPLRTWDWGQS